jgi:transposase-like protein
MMYVRFPLTLRQVENLLHERGIGDSHKKTACAWWNRPEPMLLRKLPHCSFDHALNSG